MRARSALLTPGTITVLACYHPALLPPGSIRARLYSRPTLLPSISFAVRLNSSYYSNARLSLEPCWSWPAGFHWPIQCLPEWDVRWQHDIIVMSLDYFCRSLARSPRLFFFSSESCSTLFSSATVGYRFPPVEICRFVHPLNTNNGFKLQGGLPFIVYFFFSPKPSWVGRALVMVFAPGTTLN